MIKLVIYYSLFRYIKNLIIKFKKTIFCYNYINLRKDEFLMLQTVSDGMKLYNDCLSVINKHNPIHKKIPKFIDTYIKLERLLKTNRIENPQTIKNILVVQMNAMGDLILSSGFLRELRKNYPDAHITFVVLGFWYNLAKDCPYVDRVVPCFAMDHDAYISMKTSLAFCRDYLWFDEKGNPCQYDLAINSHWGQAGVLGSFVAWLSTATYRAGFAFDTELRYFKNSHLKVGHFTEQDKYDIILTHKLNNPLDILHEVDRRYWLLENIDLLDINLTDKRLEMWITESYPLPNQYNNIAIGLGASYNSKKYPANKLFKALKAIYTDDINFVLFGGFTEIDDVNYLINKFETYNMHYTNLVDKTSVQETGSAIQQCKMYVGNDTGVLHMAVAANKPVISCICEPKDSIKRAGYGSLSSHARFHPYYGTIKENDKWIECENKAIVLQPEHSLEECKTELIHSYCKHVSSSHCITQIDYKEIVKAFNKLKDW